MRLEFDINRSAKAAALLVAFASFLVAYNEPNWDHFMQLMSVSISIIMGLLLIAYWPDDLLRIIAGCVFIASLNNLYDEFFGDPYKFELNEKIFACVLAFFTALNLHTLYKQVKDGPPADE